ncbi:hypothetical protein CEE37_11890 [candidate division LCP-89 bacterium B3_LCP]|uniref:RNA polymerase sigma factor n=1 Tax=candidate division LCP-89 bacterium B3_LCP TaxID=2012998 RepID=A0A532UW03_UNCL8|nr:MAG: hypothetical protein CEE37_11890 [candidate division LCP-89 bacterium B3_LCP]
MDWESIYQKHSRGIYQYLLNMSGNSHDAEDLLQETFIKAMKSEAALREPDRIHSWLMTISRNLFLDLYKKKMRRNTSTAGNFSDGMMEIPAEQVNPERNAVLSDFRSKLLQAMGELSETYRTAFTLSILQKHSYREIGEITGWTPAMVKINVFRARRKIATVLVEFRG